MRASCIAALALVCCAVSACRDVAAPKRPRHDAADMEISVSLANAPNITQVRLRVTAADLPDTVRVSLSIESGVASGSVVVPAGMQRTFTLQAFDGADILRYQGSATIDVIPGSNPPLTIVMRPFVPGTVPITGTVGTYAVVVTPSEATLAPGARLRLTAILADPHGDVVKNAVPTWESLDATVATVDAAGEVTALVAGRAGITVSYAGAADTTMITVSGAASFGGDTLFIDTFESGSLTDVARWERVTGTGSGLIDASADGITPLRGSRVLKFTSGGGTATHFVTTGSTSPYDRLKLSYRMYRTPSFQMTGSVLRTGGIRGSVTRQGSFGIVDGAPGSCPDDPNNVNHQEFMLAFASMDLPAGLLRTYTSWLGQQKWTRNPPTCGSVSAGPSENIPPATYYDPDFAPAPGVWHHFEIEVKLNDVGTDNGWAKTWVDGVLKVEHRGVRYRTTPDMKLWAATFEAWPMSTGAWYVDDVVITGSSMTSNPGTTVASVTVSPTTVNLPVGTTASLTATPLDAAGSPLAGRAITWTTSAPGVATVSSSGEVRGIAGGTATITATSEGKSGSATVTVAVGSTGR
jgi:uncharacterized protein YjdB